MGDIIEQCEAEEGGMRCCRRWAHRGEHAFRAPLPAVTAPDSPSMTAAPLMPVEEFAQELQHFAAHGLQKSEDLVLAAYRRAISEVERLTEELDVYRERVAGASLENTALRSEVERVTRRADEGHAAHNASFGALSKIAALCGMVDVDEYGDVVTEVERVTKERDMLKGGIVEFIDVGAVRGDAAIREEAGTSDGIAAPSSVQPPAYEAPPIRHDEKGRAYRQTFVAGGEHREYLQPPADREPPSDYEMALSLAPERIWLHHDGHLCTGNWTWCEDKIHDDDIEYTRPAPADLQEFTNAIDALQIAQRKWIDALNAEYSPGKNRERDDRWLDLVAARTEVMRLYKERQ